MDRVSVLLTDLCTEIESQVKPNLWGMMGAIVRGYLPQVWVFETETRTCYLFLDTEGNARVFPGAGEERDVTVKWREEALVSVLGSKDRSTLTTGDYPNVVVHTDKGRVAFNYLKKEIGL